MFWKTVKSLSKKRSVDFAVIMENGQTLRTTTDIVECLRNHFERRLAASTLDPNKLLAHTLGSITTGEVIQHCVDSNLIVSEDDIRKAIAGLKNKSSAGHDHVSNQMVKLLPASLHSSLTLATDQFG